LRLWRGGHPAPSSNGYKGSADLSALALAGYSERLIGSIRRDCLDHVVVFGERHLRHLLNSYQKYYNEARTHLSLHKDAPIPRTVQTVVVSRIFRTFGLAERRPALAHPVMAPLICSSFSSSMLRYLLVDHAVPAMWRT